AGLLRAAERRPQVAQEPAIDPGDADTHLPRGHVRAFDVLRPDRGGEAIGAVVRHADRVLVLVEWLDVAAGSEDLLAHRFRVLVEAGPDRGLDPRALGHRALHLRRAAAGDDLGAVALRGLVIGEHLFAVAEADERSLRRRLVERIAAFQAFGLGLQRVDELVEDRPLDIDALGVEAYLAAIREHRARHAIHRRVEIAIGVDDRRILAAELERDVAHADGGVLHDRGAGRGL